MGTPEPDYLSTALEAAQRAGEVILQNLGSLSKDDVQHKQVSDYVTRVDRTAEKIIIETIHAVFPDHHFLAEESSHEAGQKEFLWIIDPLDGTTNYIHGYPQFSVSIALQHSGKIIVAVVYDPVRNEFFTAEKNSGAFLNKRPIRVSNNSLPDSLISTGFPFRSKKHIDKYLELFKNIFNRVSGMRRAGSAALDLAWLAAGRCDGFFEIGLSPWDIAAGSLLIHEAGGIVTDFGGGPDYLLTGNIVACTPALHKEILNEVKGVFIGIIDK
jgi:myo-inositol-1(or 4)-monophosphatase